MTAAQLAAGAFTAILYAFLTTAAYYLGARAMITRPIWERYPARLDSFMLCAACSGFWYGAAVAVGIGWHLDLPYLVLDGQHWATPLVVGFCSIVWTPILSAKHLASLETTTGNTAVIGPDEGQATKDIPADNSHG